MFKALKVVVQQKLIVQREKLKAHGIEIGRSFGMKVISVLDGHFGSITNEVSNLDNHAHCNLLFV